MKEILILELKRASRSKGFWISILLGNIIAVCQISCYIHAYHAEPLLHTAIAAWLGTDYRLAFNPMFYVLLPILAVLPHAGSYYMDLKSGYIKNLCVKISRKDYYIGKYLTVFLFSAIAVMIPLLFNLFLTMSIYPMRRPDKLLFLTAGIIDIHMFSEFFNLYPLLYCFVYILIDGIFAGMLSIFCICISEHVKSLFSVLSVPFAIYVPLGFLLSGSSRNTWSLMQMLNPLQSYVVYNWQLLIYLLGGILLSSGWIYFKGRRKDIL